ncbi:enoyl-CoA hydratase/isomerase family protein [Streptomyces sp. NPDC047453]|uniref:enoyl-CoA hydratase/isomerase family protein n=1 Tax=Streptomyces sp. NPDC047453 TaxID=3154812 RepID=UPI0033CDE4B5
MSDINVGTEGKTSVLTLNRPEHHNSVGGALFGELIEAAEAADADPDVRAIVVTGAGSSFCVGLDAKALMDNGPSGLDVGELGTDGAAGRTGNPILPYEARRVDHLGVGRWVARFTQLGTPTVAAINGAAAGGGFALAMLHDIRVMSRTAKLATAFPSLGLTAEMGLSWVLPRIVGQSKAFRILTRGTPIGAEEALDLGLVDAVVEPEELLDAALEFARPFADVYDRSVRTTKRLLQQGAESTLMEQLEREWLAQRLLMADPRMAEAMEGLRRRLGK